VVALTHRRRKSASIECAKHAALLANSTTWQCDLGLNRRRWDTREQLQIAVVTWIDRTTND